MTWQEIYGQLINIPGGYVYSGAASLQVCFHLKKGGELRFCVGDDDDIGFDYYDGSLPPCITGPSHQTGSNE